MIVAVCLADGAVSAPRIAIQLMNSMPWAPASMNCGIE